MQTSNGQGTRMQEQELIHAQALLKCGVMLWGVIARCDIKQTLWEYLQSCHQSLFIATLITAHAAIFNMTSDIPSTMHAWRKHMGSPDPVCQ